MRINKFKYFSIIAFIFFSLILINIFLGTNEKNSESKISIKYDRNINNNQQGEVRITNENNKIGAEFMPIPHINKSIILDAL